MHIDDIVGKRTWAYGPERPVVGLDIGSRGSKGVLLHKSELFTVVIGTGLYMQQTADEVLQKLLSLAGLDASDLAYVVGTGYGRVALKYEKTPYQVVTEISCHAMGAHALAPNTRTIIDIGGQDSKAIKVDPLTGKVVEFVMNDKCAAGTGRFLEKAALLLGIDLQDLGNVALQSKSPAQVSSQCVVFAESEIISLRARSGPEPDNEVRANIAAGVHYSTSRRIQNLLGRIGIESDLVFSGGVSNNPGMWHALEELLEARFLRLDNFDMIFAGALGAAVFASKYAIAARPEPRAKSPRLASTNLTHFQELIADEQRSFIDSRGDQKRVGYLCNYTPVELFNAAGTRHVRLFKAGDQQTVSQGERYTQSVFCDFTKSCIGGIAGKDPLYSALDKVYNFHSCATMKRATEMIGEFVPTELLNLPKLHDHEASRRFYREELLHLKKDLEELTGNPIDDEKVREQIVLYNKLRALLKDISELRKKALPPISGKEFVDLVKGYYYLPPQESLKAYETLYEHLKSKRGPRSKSPPIRLIIAGSIVADGDRRILEIVEDELGARVVVEDHCAGARPFYNRLPEDGDCYQALAEGYLAQAPCARNRPLEAAVNFSGKLAQDYKVDGVLFIWLKFCACYGISKREFLLKYQELGLPILEISNDYSQSDHGQLKTRIGAFIEVLKEKQEHHHANLANG